MIEWNIGDHATVRTYMSDISNQVFNKIVDDVNPIHHDYTRMSNSFLKFPVANGIQIVGSIGAAIVKLFTTDSTMPIALE